MKPMDLVSWRMAKKMSKSQLATALSVHRHTVRNWEDGTFAIPGDLSARLSTIAGVVEEARKPDFLSHNAWKQFWPSYRVYKQSEGRKGMFVPDVEHPCKLNMGYSWSEKVPAGVMDSVEYQQAVELYRQREAAEPPRFSLGAHIAAVSQAKITET